MAAGPTQTSDVNELIPEILTDAVRGQFRNKQALMNSILVSSGAIAVSNTLPGGRKPVLGQTVNVPYFGTIGDFEDRTESQSATIVKVGTTEETATVQAARLAFEVSFSARNAGDEDPYDEHARQIVESGLRKMDSLMVTKGATSPLVQAHYSATTPHYLTYQDLMLGKARKLGDEQEDIVALVAHSLVVADWATQTDSVGRPLNTLTYDGTVPRLAGHPILVSDSLPLTGSTMGTQSSGGTGTPPTLTIAGTPNGPHELRVEIVDAGSGNRATATFRFSVDGGNTWSATMACASFATATAATDTATDSLVGKNGLTGLTLAFADDQTFVADHYWTATANLSVETQIWQRGAGAFWWNEDAFEVLTDKDILEHTDIAALHLYCAPHLYRRRNGGSRPGVARFTSNVQGFTG